MLAVADPPPWYLTGDSYQKKELRKKTQNRSA